MHRAGTSRSGRTRTVRIAPCTGHRPQQAKRALAREVGVDAAVAPGEEASAADSSGGFHLVTDATGRPEAIGRGLGLVRRGGTFLVFGVAPEAVTVPVSPYALYYNDLTMVGSMAINGTFGAAARLAPTLALQPLLAPPRGLQVYPEATTAFGRGARPKQQLAPTTD